MVRNYEEKDLESIQKLNFMLWLGLQWNRTYHKEDAFVAVDENGTVVGVAAMFWDGTWYYLEKGNESIPLYRMQLELTIDKECENEKAIKKELLQKAKEHFNHYQKLYQDKKLCLRCWCMAEEKSDMQDLLEEGFDAYGITMILAYDLTKDIPERKLSLPIDIGIHNCDDAGIQAYLKANEAGYDGIQDSEDELRFMLSGEETKLFTARVQDQVISSCIIWRVEEGRCATENVFTIPEYRRQGVGSETLYTALRYLKEKGEKLATLTVMGTNHSAIAMYLSMGYELMGNMYEMHYNPVED